MGTVYTVREFRARLREAMELCVHEDVYIHRGHDVYKLEKIGVHQKRDDVHSEVIKSNDLSDVKARLGLQTADEIVSVPAGME